jgi:hypothetical protein
MSRKRSGGEVGDVKKKIKESKERNKDVKE